MINIQEQHVVESNKKKLINFCSVFGTIILAAIVLCWVDRYGIKVTMQEYGTKWPFTYPVARLTCDGGIALVKIDGKKYGLTHKAEAKGYPSIDSVWREDPEKPGSKIWPGDITARAREHCRY
ncbi:DUF2511 domain-containing protein [Desulfosediminicola flagellatus]|uniref:DUF2511 domain-containing protein n=1 Tax=Desulfosediminicola flagellatus TaxID=2569541 RepID=UPI00142F168D|nr:DUF2511 domain-containing protein [Desulfosediminicola flagellatus]